MHKTVLFVRANDEVAEHLQKAISAHAASLPQASGLSTVFVVLRRFQSTARPDEVASQMLMSVDPVYVRHLNPAAFKEPYQAVSADQCRQQALTWMRQGVAKEGAAFTDDEAANAVLDELFGWVGTPSSTFVNHIPLFKVAGVVDRGIALVGSNRIGMLWFMGAE